MMKPMLTIATYQGPAFRNQPDAAIEKILSICELSKNADIILFPETFVHGYFDNETDAKKAEESVLMLLPGVENQATRLATEIAEPNWLSKEPLALLALPKAFNTPALKLGKPT